MKTIIRELRGPNRKEVAVSEIQVPDLWPIAMSLPKVEQEAVLEVWHLCHCLIENIQADESGHLL